MGHLGIYARFEKKDGRLFPTNFLANSNLFIIFRYGGSPAIPRQVIRNHRGEIEVRKKFY